MRSRAAIARLLLLGILGVAPAAAAESGSADRPWSTRRWASWQLHWENDVLLLVGETDRFYTNGLRFNWLHNPRRVGPDGEKVGNPGWAESVARWWCRSVLCPEPGDVGAGHALGQSIYTPTDISVSELIPDDRPYAAWLYYSLLLNTVSETAAAGAASRPVQNLFELQLGFVGREAGGEFLQRHLHELIGSQEPRGWDHQLGFEPGVSLLYLWRKRIGTTTFDFVPHWGTALGNIATYVNAGATVRLGHNISGFPSLIVAPTVAVAGPADPRPWEFFVFAGVDGRGVARNIFLDGNTFKKSHSVDKEPFVYDLKAGLSVRYRAWRLDYTHVRRSREFAPPPLGDDGIHDFGSVSLTYRIWPPPAERSRSERSERGVISAVRGGTE